MTVLSVVVPCYNEEASLPLFFVELKKVSQSMVHHWENLRFEVVLVDDGSSDNTLRVFKKLETEYKDYFSVLWLSFSRNFGKEAALYAGLQHDTGDFVATMDADMQDPPSLLPQMYEILQSEDYDNVAGKTKWNFFNLFVYALDGIVAFSTMPLIIASIIGIILCLVALLMVIVIVVKTLAFGDPVAGWPSMMCAIMFIGGMQLLSVGILGQYLAKLYLEIKHRPIYI